MPDALKDSQYDDVFFDTLIAAIQRAYPAFDAAAFRARVFDSTWDDLALKARMRHVTQALRATLPEDYRAALDILRDAARHTTFAHFGAMSLPDFVEQYGLDDWEASLPALEQFTQQISGEFAVRPFILQDPPRMMARMLDWAGHPNEHVRRLASEGCRPRLPWGMALPVFKADPGPILPVLERLKEDPSEYVRRSVANNLNDIAKDNPQVVLDVLRDWRSIDTPEMAALIKHALRTLVKQGDPAALALLGYGHDAAVAVRDLRVTPAVVPEGGDLSFSFDVISEGDAPQRLVIDYVLHLKRANGEQTPKVFKLAERTLQPGEVASLTRRFSFRPVTTRRYYPGEHGLEIQINGQSCARVDFMVGEG
ncbi:MAG: DNA alkylation repair protein [Anaerolineae bacterium]|nr:DNA alkylation repair protein [Anaerolineae bacterium]